MARSGAPTTGGFLAAVLVGSLIVVPGQTGPALAAETQPACATEAVTDVAAAAMAARCGSRVEVSEERSEFTQVFAEPSGSRTLVSAATPQRVRRTDGSWTPVSTDLVPRGDGLLAPAASPVDVRFSGGGTGPLVTWRSQGSVFTLAWPSPLPAPRVEGDTAVYESVLPDVNLHVTATVDGFRHALEVRTPAAAAQPALRQIRYLLGGNLRAVSASGGGLELLDATGQEVASSTSALMWDSSVNPARVGEVAASGSVTGLAGPQGELRSTWRRPGVAAARAPVKVAVGGSEVVLTPASTMLLSAGTTYPLRNSGNYARIRYRGDRCDGP